MYNMHMYMIEGWGAKETTFLDKSEQQQHLVFSPEVKLDMFRAWRRLSQPEVDAYAAKANKDATHGYRLLRFHLPIWGGVPMYRHVVLHCENDPSPSHKLREKVHPPVVHKFGCQFVHLFLFVEQIADEYQMEGQPVGGRVNRLPNNDSYRHLMKSHVFKQIDMKSDDII